MFENFALVRLVTFWETFGDLVDFHKVNVIAMIMSIMVMVTINNQ